MPQVLELDHSHWLRFPSGRAAEYDAGWMSRYRTQIATDNLGLCVLSLDIESRDHFLELLLIVVRLEFFAIQSLLTLFLETHDQGFFPNFRASKWSVIWSPTPAGLVRSWYWLWIVRNGIFQY